MSNKTPISSVPALSVATTPADVVSIKDLYVDNISDLLYLGNKDTPTRTLTLASLHDVLDRFVILESIMLDNKEFKEKYEQELLMRKLKGEES